MKIERTATIAWSPAIGGPQYIAAGSVAGVLDASFSAQSQLEIFTMDAECIAHVSAGSSWSAHCTETLSLGVLAAGMENGEVCLYNPSKLTTPDAIVMNTSAHTGAVRGVDFNSAQPNLLGTGAGQAEILIWDLNKPTAPYSPGTMKNARLSNSEIVSLAWNKCVPQILATSSSNGVVVVWDLRMRHEVFSLNAPASQSWNATGSAGQKGAVVAWHPEVPTKFLTAMEDDQSPFLYTWDLQNAHAPLKVLSGHTRGVLDVAWCPKDPDLLLSCGKDNKVLCWNATFGESIGEFPHSLNWCFNVQWCPRNPDLISVASFDGTITTWSLLSKKGDKSPDPFADARGSSHVVLKRPPKWLRRPTSVAFGYGGKIVYFEERTIKVVQVGSPIFDVCSQLQCALKSNKLFDLCQQRGDAETSESKRIVWVAMQAIFDRDKGRRTLLSCLKAMNTCFIPDELKGKWIEQDAVLSVDDAALQVEAMSLEPCHTIQDALIYGNFSAATDICLKNNSDCDALLLAACGGRDLFVNVRSVYLKKHETDWHKLLEIIVNGDFGKILDLNLSWGQMLSCALTYCSQEHLSNLCAHLGNILYQSKEELGAIICFLLGGKIDLLAKIWAHHYDEALANSELQSSLKWGPKVQSSTLLLHNLIELVSVAMRGVESSQMPISLSPYYAKYADILAKNGYFTLAWDILENHAVNDKYLRNQVYNAMPNDNSSPPEFPFEIMRVHVPEEEKVIPQNQMFVKPKPFNQPNQMFNQPPNQSFIKPPNQMFQPPNQPFNQYNQPFNQYNQPPNQSNQPPNQSNQPPNQSNQPPNQSNQPPNQMFTQPKAFPPAAVPVRPTMVPGPVAFVPPQPNQEYYVPQYSPPIGNIKTGWNDAPVVAPPKKSAANVAPITAPFATSSHPPPSPPSYQMPQQQMPPPPMRMNNQQQPWQMPAIARPPTPKEEPANMEEIAEEHLPVYNFLSSAVQQLKASPYGTQQPKMVDDIEKRMKCLFDSLARHTVTPAHTAPLLTYVECFQSRDFSGARTAHQDMTKTKFEPWMLGLKRLLDIVANQ